MTNQSMTPTRGVRRLNPPGPSGYPLVGIAPKVGKDFLGFFVRVAEEYGGLVTLNLGTRRMFLVSAPEYLKQVLLDNHRNYAKGYEMVKPLFGDGLLTSDGESWLRQRRLMQPAFHQQHLVSFSSTMVELTQDMLARWQKVDMRVHPVDVASEMMKLTQRIILRTMFSTDISANQATITRAFDIALNHFNMALFSPLSKYTWLPTPANRRFHWAIRTLDQAVYGLMHERKAAHRDENDLLSMLMNAQDTETGARMTDKQVRDEIMTIYLAGHETTATTLAWTWYLLAQHPEVEQKLHDEHARVLAGRAPAVTDLPNLTYTRNVIDEALRLYPPAWMFARRAVEDDMMGGYIIPAGSMLMISPYVTHHLPSLWDKPDVFDPERFSAEQAAGRNRFAYIPFSAGPRICIGNNFALMEAQLILATVAQQYRLRLAPGYKVTPRPRATLRPFPGVYMVAQ